MSDESRHKQRACLPRVLLGLDRSADGAVTGERASKGKQVTRAKKARVNVAALNWSPLTLRPSKRSVI
jgi:hypothetical protein